jgi:hypothetical protein
MRVAVVVSPPRVAQEGALLFQVDCLAVAAESLKIPIFFPFVRNDC